MRPWEEDHRGAGGTLRNSATTLLTLLKGSGEPEKERGVLPLCLPESWAPAWPTEAKGLRPRFRGLRLPQCVEGVGESGLH